jgi:Kdo2-lipid IVA lauroyltransferase/acyltransferase
LDYLVYLLLRAFIALFRLIPFGLAYFFADIAYIIGYHVVGYRKNVVFTNLRKSFPGKTEEEYKTIAKGFYHHFGDIIIESIKSFTMTEAQIVERYKYTRKEELDQCYREGRQTICVAGHYANWEWGGIASGTQLLHRPVGFYKPLSNKYIDAYTQSTRVQGRSVLVSITNTRTVFETDWGEPAIFYMIADQSPTTYRLAHWITFLNQETAVLHGPERYARLLNLPVFYAWIKPVKRGYYTLDFIPLSMEPRNTKTGEISALFMKILEDQITENPRYYLWSHRRWKIQKPEPKQKAKSEK